MRLSKLYTNQEKLFEPIHFIHGLNVVLGEIRLEKNKDKDTHNLGKTTLARLLDFCFLKGKSREFFLFKNSKVFKHFVFYLELELDNGSCLTIRRSVEHASKISFLVHSDKDRDFSKELETVWNHENLPFDKAKQLLDSLLDWKVIKPWSYRTAIGYFLRIQKDFNDVFQLDKFRSTHADWKPYLAKILGFDSESAKENYELSKKIDVVKQQVSLKRSEITGLSGGLDKVEGMLMLKAQEGSELEKQIKEFDFRFADENINKELVERIETTIAALNERKYYLSLKMEKIEKSLEDHKVVFDQYIAEKIFKESGILFSGQIKKEFSDLLEFNKKISEERKQYLSAELEEIKAELEDVKSELDVLGKKRSESLSFLSEEDSVNKYRSLNNQLVQIKADIATFERQRDALLSIKELQDELLELDDKRLHVKKALENSIEAQNYTDSTYSKIRLYFSEVVRHVLSRNGLIATQVNKEGNLEFKAEILDESGRTTNEDLGTTYRKLLCVAFDLAVARAYANENFSHFVYHDGILEGLDDRKKENLLSIIKMYTKYNIQIIITAIDSDLPVLPNGKRFQFERKEVIKVLHDEGKEGRLFKMDIW